MITKKFVDAAKKPKGRLHHAFRLPLTPIDGTVGDVRSLCGQRFNVTALDTNVDHLWGCGRCDQRKRTAK